MVCEATSDPGVLRPEGVFVTFELDRSSDDRGRFTDVMGVLGAA